MTDELERRLRDHLTLIDRMPVKSMDGVVTATHHAHHRRVRHRVAGIAMAALLVGFGGLVVWSSRANAPSSIAPVQTPASAAPADPLAVTSTAVPASELPVTPVPATTVPATTVPATTVPATTVLATTVPSTSPGASAWVAIAPDPRGPAVYPAVVWTGTEALVVGGTDAANEPTRGAAAYDPATNTWRTLAAPLGDGRRIDPLVAWTGSEMLVIGGDNPDGSLLVSSGQAYDAAADAWRFIASPPVGFVDDRSPWVWTGSRLLVWPWDGGGSSMPITPIAYDPGADAWTTIAPPPIERRQHAASVWSGTEWIVWGGTTGTDELADGAAYDPSAGTWRTLAASPLSARRVLAVWTGTEMIVDGGSAGGDRVTGNGETALADGAAYDPATDTWRGITPGLAHPGFVPVWTGKKLIMFAKSSAAVYDVATDGWVDTCCQETGSGYGGTPVWTGSQVLLVGSGSDQAGGAFFTPPAMSS